MVVALSEDVNLDPSIHIGQLTTSSRRSKDPLPLWTPAVAHQDKHKYTFFYSISLKVAVEMIWNEADKYRGSTVT